MERPMRIRNLCWGGVGAELEDRRVLEEGAGEGRVVRPQYLREEVVVEELEDH